MPIPLKEVMARLTPEEREQVRKESARIGDEIDQREMVLDAARFMHASTMSGNAVSITVSTNTGGSVTMQRTVDALKLWHEVKPRRRTAAG